MGKGNHANNVNGFGNKHRIGCITKDVVVSHPAQISAVEEPGWEGGGWIKRDKGKVEKIKTAH